MAKIDFYIFKGNTEAIAVNRGFYYQYLKTLDIWLDNYINNRDVEIYCEREDDIFEVNNIEEKYTFRQVKCYTENFSLNSPEIKNTLLHFYSLYLQHETKDCFFYFETNAGTKPVSGKILNKWWKSQQMKDFNSAEFKPEVQKILKAQVKKRYDKYLLGKKIKIDKKKAKNTYDSFNRNLKSTNFELFLNRIIWDFSEKDPNSAITELRNNIYSKLKSKHIEFDESIDENLIFGYLLNIIVERSTLPDKNDRILEMSILKNLPHQANEIVKSLKSEVKRLLETNFKVFETFLNLQLSGAEVLMEKGNYEEAKIKYQKTISLLEKHHYSDETNIYQIYKNLAYCFHKLSDQIEWAKWTLKFTELKPTNSMNIYEAFIANDVLGNESNCNRLRDKLLIEFPESEAYVLFQIHSMLQGNIQNLEKFEKDIPSSYFRNKEINLGLAYVFYKNGNQEKFQNYFESVISMSPPQEQAEYKAILAYKISIPIIGTTFSNFIDYQFTPKEKENLFCCIKLYKEAWKYFKCNEQSSKKAHICINIGVIYLKLGSYEEALEFVNEAISNKDTSHFRCHRVMIYQRSGDSKKILKECENLDFSNIEVQHVFLTYLSELIRTGDKKNCERAVKIAYSFIEDYPISKIRNRVIYTLVDCLLKENRLTEVEVLLAEYIENESDSLFLNIAASKLFNNKGDGYKRKQYLKKAMISSINSETEDGLYALSSELFNSELTNEAIEVLTKMKRLLLMPEERKLLLECYLKQDAKDKALNLCQEVRETSNNKLDPYFVKIELRLLNQMKDYKCAIPIAKKYCQEYTEDILGRISLCKLYLNAGEIENARNVDLDTEIDSNFSAKMLTRLVVILIRLNRKSIIHKLIYDFWRVDQSEEACLALVQICNSIDSTKKELKIKVASEGTAIFLKSRDKIEEQPYILYDYTFANNSQQEINKKNLLYKKLIGVQVGDKIFWGKNMLGDNYKEVVELMTTHQFAFLEALKKMKTIFDNNPTFYVGKAETIEEFIDVLDRFSNKNEENVKRSIEDQNKMLNKAPTSQHHQIRINQLKQLIFNINSFKINSMLKKMEGNW